jgi:hypothetical protein
LEKSVFGEISFDMAEYPHKIWPYMVQYLHFRILKFPLMIWEITSKWRYCDDLQLMKGGPTSEEISGLGRPGWILPMLLATKKIPSGKHTKNDGKSPLLLGKSTISMAIFNSYSM